MIRSGMSLHEHDVQPADQRSRHEVGAGGRREAARHREPPPRYGVVNCPDGPHRVNLAVIRHVMTRMLVAGEPGYDVNTDLARKAGVSRSTVSRMLRGQATGLTTMQSVLAVLKIPYGDVVSTTPMPAEAGEE
jgi:DNA-binding Xre family transcriptional regulator